MGLVGIVGAGAYVPCRRLQRRSAADAHAWFAPGLKTLAKGEKAFANWDEDAITMAVEAARDALTGHDRAAVSKVLLASTSHPFADRQNAGIVKEALNLPDAVGVLDLCGSQRAGTSALIEALDLARAGHRTLCMASEKRNAKPGSETELTSADGAAALLVGGDNLAAELLGTHTVAIDFVDHFRAEGRRYDYSWEPRWVRDDGYGKIVVSAIRDALKVVGIAADAVDHFIAATPMRGVNAAMARAVGIPPDRVVDALMDQMGDSGATHPLLMLVHALERAKAGETILVVSFGAGCDVLVFRATGKPAVGGLGVSGWLARRRPENNYVRYLALKGELELESGMRAEFDQKTPLTVLYRNRRAVFGLVGVRNPQTGAVQYPPTSLMVGETVGEAGPQEPHPLADRQARVVTFTADSLTYSPDPPCCYGAIEFEGGGRMTAEFVDVDPERIEIGTPMRMMFRVKARDTLRGFTHYFWKATPDYLAVGGADAAQAAE
ncbi:MAG: hydroxymethylglutaryl-CoA synthase family protein [Rhodospirillaceae bacterium]|nr:MAG: hydroxymethylglutaryl-CoA synthase family protein [Rhodospirillaceae bacterium]